MKFAPITLFVYNRPWHTRQTVEALLINSLAAESDLFIYCDGPKTHEQVQKTKEVREYIRSIRGFKTITIVERDENCGLAKSIVTGVTEVVSRFGKIIVLEDDLVTAPFFLEYMNDALERYREEERVMHIAGYMYPIDASQLPQTFFFRQTSCWGWGTWQRAWKHLQADAAQLAAQFDVHKRYSFTIEGAYDFWDHLQQNCTGAWETWAIKWYATVFLKNGLCLHPSRSLVANIGFDATGTNCRTSSLYDVALSEVPVQGFETSIKENEMALKIIRRYLRPSLLARIKRMVSLLQMTK